MDRKEEKKKCQKCSKSSTSINVEKTIRIMSVTVNSFKGVGELSHQVWSSKWSAFPIFRLSFTSHSHFELSICLLERTNKRKTEKKNPREKK